MLRFGGVGHCLLLNLSERGAVSEQASGHPAADSGNKHSHRKGSGKKRSREKIIGGKVLAWAAGVVGSAIAAFVTAYITTLGTAAAAAHPASPPPDGQPVLVTVGNVAGHDGSFAFPDPVTLSARQIRDLSAAQGNLASTVFTSWYSAHHGAFVGAVSIQLVVQGNRHHLVRIINITPVESCSAPLHGTMFFFPGQGADESARLYLDLDHPLEPDAYALGSSAKRYADYFGRYSVSLRYDGQFTFQVTTSTSNQYCAFKLALTIIDDGKKVTETVDDHGQPFRLTSLPERGNRVRFSSYQVLYLDYASADSTFNPSGPPWVRGNPKKYVS